MIKLSSKRLLNNNLVFLFIVLFSIDYSAKAQIVLDKEATKEWVSQIAIAYGQEEYEMAIILLESEVVVVKKNLPRDYRRQFESLQTTIANLKITFEKNDSLVEQVVDLLKDSVYCDATNVITKELSYRNSYKATQRKMDVLKPVLDELQKECMLNHEKLVALQEEWDNGNHEAVYFLVNDSLSNDDWAEYLYTEDKKQLNTLKADVTSMLAQSKSTKAHMKDVRNEGKKFRDSIQPLKALTDSLKSVLSDLK